MVLWVDSFRRLVDPTIVQAPQLLASARREPRLALPAVVPVADRDALLSITPAVTRGTYMVAWHLRPEWTTSLRHLVNGQVEQAVEYGALNLAGQTLDLLHILGSQRDIRPLESANDRFADLMTGRVQLPALPNISQEVASKLGL